MQLPDDQFEAIDSFLAAYRTNEPAALQVMDETLEILGLGLVNLVNLFNPERIAIGGWAGLKIAEAGLEPLTDYVKRNALPPSAKELVIEKCQFGEDAICTGAACLVLGQFLSGNSKFYGGAYKRQPLSMTTLD